MAALVSDDRIPTQIINLATSLDIAEIEFIKKYGHQNQDRNSDI